jgi:probable O-glycosylation ligase (exosortase A-associated)
MTVPLLMFFRSIATYRSLRLGFLVSTVLCVFAILGTQSRGALVGILVMGTFLALKSKKKAQYILLALVVGAAGYNFMPETWHERMSTITEYQTDGSAMGRIMAWRMAFNLAMHRPLGGGFQTFRPSAYLMYLPEVGARRTDAHSVYFELMAEHGFIGLGLFLVLGISTFLTCGKIARRTRRSPDDAWMNELARMLQVSFVGYAAAGAFLGLAYFNYLYALVAIVVGLRVVAEKQGALHVVERAGKWGSPATLPRAETARGFGPSHPAGVPAKPVDTLPWLPTRTELIQHAKRWYERM